MAGMMVSGASPIYAGIYQLVIVALILAASGIAGLIVTLLMRARAFSAAAQMTLRPRGAATDARPIREVCLA
jgi:putative ABC transport system permease protein